jgi:predicted acetyltransferase
MSASKLVKPSVEYKESYLEALKEYHEEGKYLYQDIAQLTDNFSTFVNALNTERGYPHQPHQEWVEPVPETIAWLVKDDNYIGTVDIRHRLNWHLEKWGGHIHATIRPSWRNKGFGKKLLLKAMPIANYLGIEKALLTVEPDNKGAIQILEACGAELEDVTQETDQFPARRRYWLDCR